MAQMANKKKKELNSSSCSGTDISSLISNDLVGQCPTNYNGIGCRISLDCQYISHNNNELLLKYVNFISNNNNNVTWGFGDIKFQPVLGYHTNYPTIINQTIWYLHCQKQTKKKKTNKPFFFTHICIYFLLLRSLFLFFG